MTEKLPASFAMMRPVAFILQESAQISSAAFCLFHFLLKAAETFSTGNIIRIILARLRVGFAEKLHHVKTAFVDIEMDVPLFKIWCVGLPDFCFRVQFFDGLPRGKSHALTVAIHINEQKLKLVAVGIGVDCKYSSTVSQTRQENSDTITDNAQAWQQTSPVHFF